MVLQSPLVLVLSVPLSFSLSSSSLSLPPFLSLSLSLSLTLSLSLSLSISLSLSLLMRNSYRQVAYISSALHHPSPLSSVPTAGSLPPGPWSSPAVRPPAGQFPPPPTSVPQGPSQISTYGPPTGLHTQVSHVLVTEVDLVHASSCSYYSAIL